MAPAESTHRSQPSRRRVRRTNIDRPIRLTAPFFSVIIDGIRGPLRSALTQTKVRVRSFALRVTADLETLQPGLRICTDFGLRSVHGDSKDGKGLA